MKVSALLLASYGYHILPLHNIDFSTGHCTCLHGGACTSPGKHPRTVDGLKSATDDPSTISLWWSQWPHANIGIATGYGHHVLDIDGSEGRATYDSYCQRFGVPIHSGHALTGRPGGEHFYLPCGDASHRAWTGGMAGHPPGLDFKAHGGYVVAPPSAHISGLLYKWLCTPWDTPPQGDVPCSEWYSAVLESLPTARDTQETHERDTRPVSAIPLLEREIEQPHTTSGHGFTSTVLDRIATTVLAATRGHRWQTLSTVGIWDTAGLVLGNELDETAAITLCQQWARTLDLTEAEIQRVPREFREALARRHEPIASRRQAGMDPLRALNGPFPSTNGATPAALPANLPGADHEVMRAARVADRKETLYIDQLARQALRRDQIATQATPTLETLADLLGKNFSPERYRIQDLWPSNGRIVVAAQYKAGKTTLMANLLRTLVDGGDFLNQFTTRPVDDSRTVCLIDTEMSEATLQNWYQYQNILNPDRIWVAPLRGMTHTFDILDDIIRERWIKTLRERDTAILAIDCIGPIIGSAGLDENSTQDIGKFLVTLDQLLHDADIPEAIIVHHMGHTGERLRGSSRLRDWPDAEWMLIRSGQEDDTTTPDSAGTRFFRAYGRDVDVPEHTIIYDRETRKLHTAVGDREANKDLRIRRQILAVIEEQPGIIARNIEANVRGRATIIRECLKELIHTGKVTTVPGYSKAIHHYLADYLNDITKVDDDQ